MTTTTLALYAPTAAPIAAAVLSLVLPWRAAAVTGVLTALSTLGSGAHLATHTASGSAFTTGLLRADALTAWMLLVIGAVAAVASCASISYLGHDAPAVTSRATRRYLVLAQLFVACMSLAVMADNLGLLWVAVEATTIVTAFLVGHQRNRPSIEAAWKYVVLCSVGIAIAFLGTVCVYAASVAAGGHGITALDWTHLTVIASTLDPDLTRLAAGLILLGFGTKAGLAPMHAWLPDAHSQAPAPVSALMSGVLLSVAMYAILRYRTITDAVIGPAYTRTLLLTAALASLAVAAVLLIAQRDYKRLLAYSSIEHMGLVALGAAIGTKLAIAAALLHILGHGLAKAAAFAAAGNLLHHTGSTDIAAVRGLTARQPALAATFSITLIALLGLPPFSLFASELGIARGGITAGYNWAIATAFILILVAFAAIARHSTTMLLGACGQEPSPQPRLRSPVTPLMPLMLALAATAALGITLGPLQSVLDTAAQIAGGR